MEAVGVIFVVATTATAQPNASSMNAIQQSPGRTRRLPLSNLAALLLLASASLGQAQSLVSSSEFFDPDYTARRPGSGSLLLSLSVNTTSYTPGSQTAGDVTWDHSAGGLVQIGASVALVGTVDVQLAAYTQTIGNSLIFGRELDVTTTGLVSGLGATITSLTDQVLGASAVNSWDTTSTVNNLGLSEGVLYSVSFDVSTGAGINLAALNTSNFSLFSGGVQIESIDSTQTLNLLDVLTLGGGTGSIDFQFYAPPGGADELTFAFDADTIADVNLLGTITDNQTVLEFTNFSLTPVPEPGSLILASMGLLMILRRRRPCGV